MGLQDPKFIYLYLSLFSVFTSRLCCLTVRRASKLRRYHCECSCNWRVRLRQKAVCTLKDGEYAMKRRGRSLSKTFPTLLECLYIKLLLIRQSFHGIKTNAMAIGRWIVTLQRSIAAYFCFMILQRASDYSSP